MKGHSNSSNSNLHSPTIVGKRIAFLEDDDFAADVVELALRDQDYDLIRFKTIEDASRGLQSDQFDLLILDWLLPDGTADQVIHLVRENLQLKTPILILSMNDAEEQVVDALLLGADDYVVKPIRNTELQVRIKVLLRNSAQQPLHLHLAPGFELDAENKLLIHNQQALKLSPIEYKLALYFFSHVEELLSREQLLEAVWGQSGDVTTRTVDTFIARLRKLLKLDANSQVQIITLRGYGYRMEIS